MASKSGSICKKYLSSVVKIHDQTVDRFDNLNRLINQASNWQKLILTRKLHQIYVDFCLLSAKKQSANEFFAQVSRVWNPLVRKMSLVKKQINAKKDKCSKRQIATRKPIKIRLKLINCQNIERN